MRPGQHNKRGRGRNRRHNGGGGGGSGGGGGGNPINRVYESNGPDVKVRGTAMTVADKYLQLGRDAQAAGDIVMAESYYQHAEHYLRIVAAAQAYNQQMQQQYKRPEDEFGDDDEGDAGDGDDVPAENPDRSFGTEAAEQPPAEGFEAPATQERRDFQNRDNRDNRDNQFGRDRNRDRHRPRWDNTRRDRDNQDQQRNVSQQTRGEEPAAAQPRVEQASEPAPVNGVNESWDGPQPSFLKRPPGGSKPRSERRPKRETAENAENAEPASVGSDDTPADN